MCLIANDASRRGASKIQMGAFQFMTIGLSVILVDFSLIVLGKQPVCTKSGHEPFNSQIVELAQKNGLFKLGD
jgi:hypothetical protein